MGHNDIPDITMSFWGIEHEIFPDITILQYQYTTNLNFLVQKNGFSLDQ